MSCWCLARIPPTPVVFADDNIDTVRAAAAAYRQYIFTDLELVSTSSGVNSYQCKGFQEYTTSERISRAVLGVFLVLATGFLGLLSPYIRSLFHAQHQITVHHNPLGCGHTMGVDDWTRLKWNPIAQSNDEPEKLIDRGKTMYKKREIKTMS